MKDNIGKVMLPVVAAKGQLSALQGLYSWLLTERRLSASPLTVFTSLNPQVI
jgi:hypothetical protein